MHKNKGNRFLYFFGSAKKYIPFTKFFITRRSLEKFAVEVAKKVIFRGCH